MNYRSLRTAALVAAFLYLFSQPVGAKMPEQIKNSRGQVIGLIEDSSGSRVIKNSRGQILGYYIKAENKTYNANVTYVGQGDQTMTLLRD